MFATLLAALSKSDCPSRKFVGALFDTICRDSIVVDNNSVYVSGQFRYNAYKKEYNAWMEEHGITDILFEYHQTPTDDYQVLSFMVQLPGETDMSYTPYTIPSGVHADLTGHIMPASAKFVAITKKEDKTHVVFCDNISQLRALKNGCSVCFTTRHELLKPSGSVSFDYL